MKDFETNPKMQYAVGHCSTCSALLFCETIWRSLVVSTWKLLHSPLILTHEVRASLATAKRPQHAFLGILGEYGGVMLSIHLAPVLHSSDVKCKLCNAKGYNAA